MRGDQVVSLRVIRKYAKAQRQHGETCLQHLPSSRFNSAADYRKPLQPQQAKARA
jgi:hypothetical protein